MVHIGVDEELIDVVFAPEESRIQFMGVHRLDLPDVRSGFPDIDNEVICTGLLKIPA